MEPDWLYYRRAGCRVLRTGRSTLVSADDYSLVEKEKQEGRTPPGYIAQFMFSLDMIAYGKHIIRI